MWPQPWVSWLPENVGVSKASPVLSSPLGRGRDGGLIRMDEVGLQPGSLQRLTPQFLL